MPQDQDDDHDEDPFHFNPAIQSSRDNRTTEQRANWALQAMIAWPGFPKADDDRESVAELLADLGHLCDHEGFDFEKAVEQAKSTWRNEREL